MVARTPLNVTLYVPFPVLFAAPNELNIAVWLRLVRLVLVKPRNSRNTQHDRAVKLNTLFANPINKRHRLVLQLLG